MKLTGRVLVLTEGPLSSSFTGWRLLGADALLHYGVNTDAMISGQACTWVHTQVLGPYFLENFKKLSRKMNFGQVVFRS